MTSHGTILKMHQQMHQKYVRIGFFWGRFVSRAVRRLEIFPIRKISRDFSGCGGVVAPTSLAKLLILCRPLGCCSGATVPHACAICLTKGYNYKQSVRKSGISCSSAADPHCPLCLRFVELGAASVVTRRRRISSRVESARVLRSQY